MKNFARAVASIGVCAGLFLLAAPPASAGGPALTVEVTGAAQCLPSGQAQVTWTATVNPPANPGTTLIVIEGMRSTLGTASQAVVQFEGVQSGAATGAVSFDPFQQTVPASNSSFPVDSQAVALDPGNTGGTVTLDVSVLIFDPNNPDQNNFTLTGAGSVELPLCEQPIAPTSASTAADTTTRPRFTG